MTRVNLTTLNHITNLTALRDLILKGWCQGDYARNADGVPVDSRSDEAVYFCPIGACNHLEVPDERPLWGLFKKVNNIPQEMPLSVWNDVPERTQARVVKAFQDTIDHLNSEE